MEDFSIRDVTRDDARDYVLDVLQELSLLARKTGDRQSEAALIRCWQEIRKTEAN